MLTFFSLIAQYNIALYALYCIVLYLSLCILKSYNIPFLSDFHVIKPNSVCRINRFSVRPRTVDRRRSTSENREDSSRRCNAVVYFISIYIYMIVECNEYRKEKNYIIKEVVFHKHLINMKNISFKFKDYLQFAVCLSYTFFNYTHNEHTCWHIVLSQVTQFISTIKLLKILKN